MKKYLIAMLAAAGMLCISEVEAQYRPTQKDVGKDCTTENGKLGVWRKVKVEESVGNTYGNTNSTSGSVGGSLGNSNVGSVSGSVSHTDSNTRGTSNSEKLTYDDIHCVEDKNATLPQRSPVRW